jgi:polysaccharide export outer membrane protein
MATVMMRTEVNNTGQQNKRLRRRQFVLPLACLLFLTFLCAQNTGAQSTGAAGPAGSQSSAQSKPAAPPSDARQHDDYIIGPEDVLAINVWKEPEISRSVPVRSDGAISLPLVGEVQAGGLTPLQLEKDIAKKLQNYISEPEVAVMVQEMKSKRFNVLGQVVRPGSYLLTNSTTVLDAIALAGGFRDFAKQKNIYVLRRNSDGTDERFPFNYKDVVKGKNVDQNIKLEPRDSVVVP